MEREKEGLTNFELSLEVADLRRRVKDNEEDIKTLKPIVYSTANDVKQIARSVDKMEKNSDRVLGLVQAGVISGIIGIIFMALKGYF